MIDGYIYIFVWYISTGLSHLKFELREKSMRQSVQKNNLWQYILFFIFLVLFLLFTFWLNIPDHNAVPSAASQVIFSKARVVAVLDEALEEDTWTEGLKLGQQVLTLEVTSGEYKGEELDYIHYLSAYGNVLTKVGTSVIVRLDTDVNMEPFVTAIINYDRSLAIIILIGTFVALLVLLGGKKGFSALVGLVFTIFCIWYFLIPLIQKGVPAILATILLVSITAIVSLVALNGFSRKTLAAIIGCVGGVSIAGLIAILAAQVSPVNGFNMPEAEEIVLRTWDTNLEVSGLLVSGILIAALGAVMDVAMMISAAIAEIKALNPKITRLALFQSGINIGRDAMGTMANTLILAFAGASLNTLILFRVFDYPYLQIFNSDLMYIEFVQGIAGSIGIVLTVPLVAALASSLFSKRG